MHNIRHAYRDSLNHIHNALTRTYIDIAIPTPRAVASRRVAAARLRAGAKARRRHNFPREKHEQGRGTGHRHRFGHDVFMRRRLATRQVRRATRRDATATIASRGRRAMGVSAMRGERSRRGRARFDANDDGDAMGREKEICASERRRGRGRRAVARDGRREIGARRRHHLSKLLGRSRGFGGPCVELYDAARRARRRTSGGVGRSREGARERESED